MISTKKIAAVALALAAVFGFATTGTAAAAGEPAATTRFTWPPAHVTPVAQTAAWLEARANRFRAHQVETVPTVVPHSFDVVAEQFKHEADGFFDGQQYMDNVTHYRVGDARASFFTQVHAPGFFTTSPRELCAQEWADCTGAVRQRDGGLLLFTQDVARGSQTVYSYRPNGEVVYVSGAKEFLSADLLAKLAADRAFTFTG